MRNKSFFKLDIHVKLLYVKFYKTELDNTMGNE